MKPCHYLILILLYGCNTQKVEYYKVVDRSGVKQTYKMTVPRGYRIKWMDFESERIKVLEYADSSRIYFSNNLKQSSFPKDGYSTYGSDLNLIFLTADSLTLSGCDSSIGRYWKVRKTRSIVVGYFNVNLSRKREFDSIIQNLSVINN
jgi:hypothetical protein